MLACVYPSENFGTKASVKVRHGKSRNKKKTKTLTAKESREEIVVTNSGYVGSNTNRRILHSADSTTTIAISAGNNEVCCELFHSHFASFVFERQLAASACPYDWSTTEKLDALLSLQLFFYLRNARPTREEHKEGKNCKAVESMTAL